MSNTQKNHIENNILSDIIIHMKYARYLPEKGRRETWKELVDRNKEMHTKKFPDLKKEIDSAYKFVYNKKVLPSLRSAQFAGKPIEMNPTRIFNCSYTPIDCWEVFNETMFLLLSGCGVGYSVQKHHIKQLPEIKQPNPNRTQRFLIDDSIAGWSEAIKILMKSYFFGGYSIKFDYSDIREKGALLVTSGGKAPGPQPLKECIVKIKGMLNEKENDEHLTSLECHDILTHIADAVLAGGIRRAAMISFFSINDQDMLACKTGRWWEDNPQRGRANNSAVFVRSRAKKQDFERVWEIVQNSGSGEPGIYFTNDKDVLSNPCCFSGNAHILTKDGYKQFKDLKGKGIIKLANKFGKFVDGKVWEVGTKKVIEIHLFNGCLIVCTPDHKFITTDGEVEARHCLDKELLIFDVYSEEKTIGVDYIVNLTEEEIVYDFSVETKDHCGIVEGCLVKNCEISLKAKNFCNLVEINASNIESQEDFNERAQAASFIGTLQASYTDFHYLRDVWRETTEEEALLGVSMTGVASNKVKALNMQEAVSVIMDENEKTAKVLGINKANRLTTIKPAGTSSLVLGSSSGIHAWHDEYYIRRIRINKEESLYKYLEKSHPELVEDDFFSPHTTSVISVPQKAPVGSVTRKEETTEMFLDRVSFYYNNWVVPGHISGANTHNISATISIKEHEWGSVKDWMWKNRNNYNGLSVLPYDGGTYVQPPFESCTKYMYDKLVSSLKSIDLRKVKEDIDNTDLSGESACSGGACEIR